MILGEDHVGGVEVILLDGVSGVRGVHGDFAFCFLSSSSLLEEVSLLPVLLESLLFVAAATRHDLMSSCCSSSLLLGFSFLQLQEAALLWLFLGEEVSFVLFDPFPTTTRDTRDTTRERNRL